MEMPGYTEGFNMSSHRRHQQDSVLAKYVERFRYGEPRSRAERRPVSPAVREEARPFCWMSPAVREEARPFWWMSPSSPAVREEARPFCWMSPSSSGPGSPHPGHMDDIAPLKEDQGPGPPSPVEPGGGAGTISLYRELLDISALDLCVSSLGDRQDTEVLEEGDSTLLQKSQSSVSSGSLVISSEGLGCSELSSPVSVNEPVRRPLSSSPLESTTYNLSSAPPTVGPSQKSTVPSLVGRQCPEEDILFQWRLRRKMEQARQWPQSFSQQFPSLHQPPSAWQSPGLHQPPSAWQSPGLHQPSHLKTAQEPEPSQRMLPFFLPISQLGSKEMHRLCPPASGTPSTSPPHPASSRTASTVPLLWDGSPGPARSSPTTQQKARGQHPNNMTPKHPQPILKSACDRPLEEDAGDRELCPPPGSPESTKEEWSTEKEHSQNERMANRTHTRSTRRHAGDGPVCRKESCSRPSSDKMVASSPQKSHNKDKRQKNSQVLHREVCCAPRAPSAPSAPSPIHQALRQAVSEGLFPTRGSSSSSRRCAAPALGANTATPVEVVSQLLREAEDSDGDEFEGDALLQLLRTQRTRVKEHISQVDSLLEEVQQDSEAA